MRLRPLSGRDVAAVLGKFGFEVVASRGSHCKLRRTLSSGQRQTLTIPLHRSLAAGTLQAIYRQAARFVAETDLQSHFYSGEPASPAPDVKRPATAPAGVHKRLENRRRRRESRGGKR